VSPDVEEIFPRPEVLREYFANRGEKHSTCINSFEDKERIEGRLRHGLKGV